jgi:hypothetical protein
VKPLPWRLALAAYAVAACGPSSSDKNPPVLYLAPFDAETEVTLQDHSPPPY